MNPLYTLCAPYGVHTNTLQTNTAWVLHITYNLCCTCTKGFTHHFGFLFIYFEAFILKALIPFPQFFFHLFFTLSYKYQVISIQHLPGWAISHGICHCFHYYNEEQWTQHLTLVYSNIHIKPLTY